MGFKHRHKRSSPKGDATCSNGSRRTQNRPPRYTHFLSLPLVHNGQHGDVVASLRQFQGNVVAKPDVYGGIDDDYFTSPEKLHFTLCMLCLNTPDRLSKAKDAFHNAAVNVLPKLWEQWTEQHFAVSLHNVLAMGTPAKTNVVYTTDEENNDLYECVNHITDAFLAEFKSAGIVSHEDLIRQRMVDEETGKANVHLHATVIKASYGWRKKRDAERRNFAVKDCESSVQRELRDSQLGNENIYEANTNTTEDGEGDGERSANVQSPSQGKIRFIRSVDASQILEDFRTNHFGTVTLRQVHMSILGHSDPKAEVTPPFCEGYYRCAAYSNLKFGLTESESIGGAKQENRDGTEENCDGPVLLKA